jgi:acetoin utilization protein AcuB
MRIQNIMSKKVISVTPETPVSTARETLRAAGIGHLVVMEHKHVAGVIGREDMVNAGDDEPVSSLMTRRVVTIEPEATLRHAASVMRGRAIGCLPVIDDGHLAGIVTTSDLLTALSKGEVHEAPPRERTILRKRGPRKHHAPV